VSQKQKAPLDNSDNLALRQQEIILRLVEGIQKGGIEPADWFNLVTDLPRATRGFQSARLDEVLRCFTRYSLYRQPRKLADLVELLLMDFGISQRKYFGKGLLQLLQGEGSSTLTEAMDLSDKMSRSKRSSR